MTNHCTQRGNGGEVLFYIIGNLAQLFQDTSFGGLFLKARETFQKITFEGNSKTTNPVVAKSYKKSKLSSGFFTSATPNRYDDTKSIQIK